MAQIKWTEEFSVGITWVDLQHKKFFELLNKLNNAVFAQTDKDALYHIVSDLVDYAVYHFNTEEKFFKEHGYPDAVNHVHEHAKLKLKAKELRTSLENEKIVVDEEVLNFMLDWLKNHILTEDMKFGEFMKANK